MAKKKITFTTFGNVDPLTCERVYYQENWLSNRLIVVWNLKKNNPMSPEVDETFASHSLGVDASASIYIEANDPMEYDIKHYVIGATASYHGDLSVDPEDDVFNQFDAINDIKEIADELKNSTQLKNNSEDQSVFKIPTSYYKQAKEALTYVGLGTVGLFAVKQFLSAEGGLDLALTITNTL